jgi:plasmid stabilization system protein ParE
MAQVIWTDPALDHLREVVLYIARQSPTNAERVRVRLVQAPRLLENNPRIGSRVPEFDRDDIRELLVKSYRLLYVLRGDMCYIVAVVRGSRDLTRAVDPADWDDL